MTPRAREAATRLLDELAGVVGRLAREARRLEDGRLARDAERAGELLEALDVLWQPSAAELVAEFAPGDDEAVEAALAAVDARRDHLRRLLGRDREARC